MKNSNMNKIEIEVPDGKKAVWVDDVLTLVDDKPKDVRDRIKTFDDARKELGEDHQFVQEWKMIRKTLAPDLEAYMRLRIITAALNEGWEYDIKEIESCCSVMIVIHTKEMYEKLTPEEKKHVICLHGKNYYEDVLRVVAGCVSSSVHTYSATSLCFRDDGLARYASKQFFGLYAKLYLPERYK